MEPSNRIKRKIERLLRRFDYHRDDRPDHREWMRFFDEFSVKIRLDQNNPEGFNGFQFQLEAYLRHGIRTRQIRKVLRYLGDWYETR